MAPHGVVYGATSGARSHLFALDPIHGFVQPLGFLKDVTTVHGSLAIAPTGDVYIGGSISVDNGGAGYDTYPGGHLLRYRPPLDQAARPIRIDGACQTNDLGVPVEHESIYSLAADAERNIVYGLTYPSGNFFRYQIAGAKFTLLGRVAEHRIHGEKFERDRLIGRAIAVDSKGNVFTSGEDGAFFRYRPGTPKIEKLAITVPAEPGREGYNRIGAMSVGADGTVYLGESEQVAPVSVLPAMTRLSNGKSRIDRRAGPCRNDSLLPGASQGTSRRSVDYPRGHGACLGLREAGRPHRIG